MPELKPLVGLISQAQDYMNPPPPSFAQVVQLQLMTGLTHLMSGFRLHPELFFVYQYKLSIEGPMENPNQ